MILVDTNILIDIFARDPVWRGWSQERLLDAAAAEGAAINVVVIAELSRGFASLAALHARLAPLALTMAPFEEDAAFIAGHVFAEYRARRDAAPSRVLPDFMMGAHATTLGSRLLTRDPALYRRYFPDVTLITPETE